MVVGCLFIVIVVELLSDKVFEILDKGYIWYDVVTVLYWVC